VPTARDVGAVVSDDGESSRSFLLLLLESVLLLVWLRSDSRMLVLLCNIAAAMVRLDELLLNLIVAGLVVGSCLLSTRSGWRNLRSSKNAHAEWQESISVSF